jgi:mannose-6-phosphate isomerase-like protein (cupin superfamily)
MGRCSIQVIVKPWGTEEIWAGTHHSVGKILTIKGGHRLSRKYHRLKNHTIRILEGSLTLEVGPLTPGSSVEALTLFPGEAYYLESRTIHRFCADEGGVTLLEISPPGADDSVRLEDDYRRITRVPDRGPQSDK